MRTPHTRPSIFGRLRTLMLALALILVPLLGLAPSHTYAATPGTVVGWGNNDAGQVTIPAELSGVTAIAVGRFHSLALKSDGTVVGWGNNYFGQVTIPAGLSGVTAIAAGEAHSLALKSDGTVVAWGSSHAGQLDIPAGLSDVTAIAAGIYHSLALKSDGTVVSWGKNTYGQLDIPAGLNDVTAIAAWIYHSLALKSDGTVVGWGDNNAGQLNIPAGLSDVTAIAAGEIHSLALKSDGTVVAWGGDFRGVSTVPAGLSGVTAIAAGFYHSLAIVAETTVPTVSPTQSPAANSAGWNTSDVTVSWNWADEAGGAGLDLASCSTSSTSSGEGEQSLSASCADLAGNQGSASYTVKVDKTAPSISAAASSAPNAAGWNNGDVTVAFSCADALSGIPEGACPPSQTLAGEGTSISSSAQTVSDVAGNASTPSNIVTVAIDATAPTLAPTVSPNPLRLGQSGSASPNASDALSGIASQSCEPLDTSSLGLKSVSCTATDLAGNSASVSASYTVLPTFPATAVLDSFDRANGAVGSNWAGLTATSFYKVAANRLDVQFGGPLVWKPTSFGADQEAFVTLSALDAKSPSQGVLLKVQSGSIPNAGALSVVYDALAKAVRVSALRLEQNGAWTLYPSQAATFASGDVLGAQALSNGEVRIYKNGALVATVTLNAADGAFFNARGGKIGIWSAAAPNAFFDDFGGGTANP